MTQFKKLASGLFTAALVIPPIGQLNIEIPDLGSILENTERKIVVFKEGTTDAERDQILDNLGSKRIKRLHKALDADVLESLTKSDVQKLGSNPKIKRIDDDVIVTALISKENVKEVIDRLRKDKVDVARKNTAAAQAQILPWGIDRIDAELVWPSGNTADLIKVGVIDTGISSKHPDLKTNIKGGINTIRVGRSWNDDNGHGSHVAGIIAAINDSNGVVGTAPSADLYAIKVLGSNGSGWLSDIIEGIDWAIVNNIQVTNMSLGTSSNIQSFHDAVIRAKNAGIIQVAAAGNSGGSVIYPAAYPEVIAVSATDSNDAIASWSSRGPEVGFSAPGVNIYSAYKGVGYATLSGTSMASPHVAGTIALMLNTPVGSYDSDNDNKWNENGIISKLKATATDLGPSGFDNLYGWGLVNAYGASN